MSAARQHYETLLHKIDDLSQRQLNEYGTEITCKVGCFDCCRPPDSLFRVEVEPLQEAIRALSPQQKQEVEERLQAYEASERELCPLLENGSCSIYEGRPVICRTQGFALWLRQESQESGESEDIPAEGLMNWCSYNFQQKQPTKEDAFDVQRLNVMLSLMTSLHWPPAEARKDLVAVIREALNPENLTESSS